MEYEKYVHTQHCSAVGTVLLGDSWQGLVAALVTNTNCFQRLRKCGPHHLDDDRRDHDYDYHHHNVINVINDPVIMTIPIPIILLHHPHAHPMVFLRLI